MKLIVENMILKSLPTFWLIFFLKFLLCSVEEIYIKMPSSLSIYRNSYLEEWYKRTGDTIGPGDALCQLQTEKDSVLLVEGDDVDVQAHFAGRVNFRVSVSLNMATGTIVEKCIEDEVGPGAVLCKIRTDDGTPN